MVDSTELLAFPIGRHRPQTSYSSTERAAFITRLATLSANLEAAVNGLSDDDYAHPYRAGGWTVRQLVHHVADSHLNMFLRVKFALAEDSPTSTPYDQDAWVRQADVELVPPAVSIALLAALHERLVALYRSLGDAEYARTLIHPENGAMRIVDVLAMYAWHGDHHVAHIARLRERESL